MTSARAWLRGGLWLLALVQATVGAWQYFAPRLFYADVPTVSADPPFNEHLMSDVGGLSLALAVVMAAAALWLEAAVIRVALTAYLVYSVSHLLFHVTHLAGLSARGAAVLLTGLAAEPAAAAALLLLARRISAPPPGPAGRRSRPADSGKRA